MISKPSELYLVLILCNKFGNDIPSKTVEIALGSKIKLEQAALAVLCSVEITKLFFEKPHLKYGNSVTIWTDLFNYTQNRKTWSLFGPGYLTTPEIGKLGHYLDQVI